MPSIAKLFQLTAVLGAIIGVDAHPARVAARQATATSAAAAAPTAPAAGGGITDIDILQFALTAEHLEAAFYAQGFAKFPASDFQALGLSDAQITALQKVGQTEADHVAFLQGAIATAGFSPVAPCEYNFGFTDAATMVATARILEAVGVSAYLGAAPLIQSPAILGTAATIATVESRHQTFIRGAAGAAPVPAAFDTPLGPRAVFTLAAQFITSCPQGSNLNIAAFPSIALANPAQATAGQSLVLADAGQPSGATQCAFVAPGGVQFAPLTNGACTIPPNLAGEVYMMVTKAKTVLDTDVLAGPSLLQMS